MVCAIPRYISKSMMCLNFLGCFGKNRGVMGNVDKIQASIIIEVAIP